MRARFLRPTAAGFLAAVLLAVTAGCSTSDDSTRRVADSVVVGIANEPETLSPLLGYGKDGNSKIFDGLLRRDARMRLRPALAVSLPKVSKDGLTYTYTVRDGVEFSDGQPLTADDVVFTYRTILDPKTNNASRSELDAIRTVRGKGAKTVVFTLKYPYTPFAERTVLPIVPRHVAGRQDVNTGPFTTRPIGTGPYLLSGWRKGEKLTFKANPHYWAGAPRVKTFTMAVIKDDDVRATRLRSGDLDGAILPPQLAATFAKDSSRRTVEAKTYDYRTVTLPTGGPVTGDRAVRRALDRAVDRGAMVKGLLNGAGKAAYGPVPTDSSWFAAGTERRHDPRAARRILDRAGWKVRGDGVRRKDGQRAAFTLWYPSGDKLRQDHALAFASDAKKVGVKVEVQSGSWEVIEPRMSRDAVLAGGGNAADPDFDQYTLLYSTLAGDGLNNMAHYDNPAVDKALRTGRESSDPSVRRTAYTTVQRKLRADPGYVFLTHIDHLYVLDDRWSNIDTQVEPHDHGVAFGPWWDVQDWRPRT